VVSWWAAAALHHNSRLWLKVTVPPPTIAGGRNGTLAPGDMPAPHPGPPGLHLDRTAWTGPLPTNRAAPASPTYGASWLPGRVGTLGHRTAVMRM